MPLAYCCAFIFYEFKRKYCWKLFRKWVHHKKHFKMISYLMVHMNIICHSSFLCTHIYTSIIHWLQNNNTATFTIAFFFDRIQTNSYFFPLLRITQHTANTHSIVRQTERMTKIRPFASPVGWNSPSWFVKVTHSSLTKLWQQKHRLRDSCKTRWIRFDCYKVL